MQPATERDFRRRLYLEHLEELAFLYEQRLVLARKDGFRWTGLDPIERRREAHLDALVLGGDLAMDVCAEPEDPGAWYGAVSLACRRDRADVLATILSRAPEDEADVQRAIADGLRDEASATWASQLLAGLPQASAALTPILLKLARRRPEVPVAGLAHIRVSGTAAACDLLRAAAARREHPMGDLLDAHLDHGHVAVRTAALRGAMQQRSFDAGTPETDAGLRMGNVHSMLAATATRAATRQIVEIAATPRATPDTMVALGIIGDVESMRALFRSLQTPGLAASAARGLAWITGASLEQDCFVEEEVDESALFPNELHAWRTHRVPPTRPDGRGYGDVVPAVPTDPAVWSAWLQSNLPRFEAGTRYRGGRACSASSVVDAMAAADASATYRRLSAVELRVRYGCPVAIDTEQSVARQMQALRDAAAWASRPEGHPLSG